MSHQALTWLAQKGPGDQGTGQGRPPAKWIQVDSKGWGPLRGGKPSKSPLLDGSGSEHIRHCYHLSAAKISY